MPSEIRDMFKLGFLLVYNMLRYVFNKLFYAARFRMHPLQRISPCCAIKLYEKGCLSIGKNCEFAKGCDIEVLSLGKLNIGHHVYMNRYCMISCHDGISIGNYCIFGPGVKIYDNNHHFSAKNGVEAGLNTSSISIGDNCWLASDVIILKGVTIGDNCLIGAGCIISEDIPAGTMVRQEQNLEKIRLD